MSKTFPRIFVGLFSALWAFVGPVGLRPMDDPPRRTGLIPPSEEQIALLRATQPRISHIHLNRIGFERVNTVRKAKGLPPLDPSSVRPVGRELERAAPAPEASALIYQGDFEIAAYLPAAVDNSRLKYFPPIRDQGPLGSCVAFVSTYTQLSYMNAIQRDLDISDPARDTDKFSPKWTYNLINDGADLGAYLTDGYDLLEKHGAATWAEFPYDDDYRAWCLDPGVWRNALPVRTDPRVWFFHASSLTEIKQLLNNGYVFAFGTYIASWNIQAFQDDPTTDADDPEVGKPVGCWVSGSAGSHAMVAVGYNDAVWVDINGNGLIEEREKGALKIANSWGTSWGDGGFIWLAYDALRESSDLPPRPLPARVPAFFYDCVYIITVRQSPPPLMLAEFTVRHAKRNQLRAELGLSDTSFTHPRARWEPSALRRDGGAFAFDGTTTAVDATFVLDFSDLLSEGAGVMRYYLWAEDYLAGDPATFSSFKIVDLTTDPATETICPFVPLTIENQESSAMYVDYDYLGPARDNHPPRLSSADQAPPFGDPSGVYSYTVRYYDEDSDPPTVRTISIDGQPFEMSLYDGGASSGRYRYTTGLATGRHDYFFLFSDGRGGTARLPLEGTFSGPDVYSFLLASLSPSSVGVGDPPFVLSVHGSNLAEGAVIGWDGVDRPTSFISAAEVTTPVAADEIASGRTVQVTVRNPDGGASNALGFSVRYPVPGPIALVPARVCAGSGGWTLLLTGSGFFPGSMVRFDGVPRATTYIGPTELRTAVAAGETVASGLIQVDVANPAPGGGASSAAPLAVAGFTISSSTMRRLTVNAGQSATYGLGLRSEVAPFDAPIALTVGHLPKGCTGTLSPATLTLESGTIGSATLTVTTTARDVGGSGLSSRAGGNVPLGLGGLLFAGLGLAALASMVAGISRKAVRRFSVAALAMGLAIAIYACSAGGGGNSAVTGTPAGTYYIEARGTSGSLTAGTTVELVVR